MATQLAFGDFVIDRADERLLGPNGPVRLGHKAYRVLLALVEQDGRLLTKDALFSSVWDGTIVSESALTSAVKELRRALGDEPRKPRYIESVYGRGYRFIAPVRAVSESSQNLETESVDPVLNIRIEQTVLPARVANVLNFNSGIAYLGDLVQMSEVEVLRIPGIGRESLNDIKRMLDLYGLRLGLDIPNWARGNLEEASSLAEAARKVAQIKQAPLGAAFEQRGDVLTIDPAGASEDFETAEKPLVRQLHEEIIRKLAAFSTVALRVDNQMGWHGIRSLCDRLSELLNRPSRDIPKFLGSLYGAALELGSFLEMDQRIASSPNSFVSSLDPDVRRPFEDLLRSFAPWLRSFPTVRQLDDEAGQFLSRDPLIKPSTETIRAADSIQLITEADAKALRALLEAAERGAFQGSKAGHRGVLSVRNMVVVATSVLGSCLISAVGSDVATKSVVVQRAGTFLVQAEKSIAEIISEMPHDLRLAIEIMIRETRDAAALPLPGPNVPAPPRSGAERVRREDL